MTIYEGSDGATHDDLVQRVALMEAMVAEGRRTTTRYGWMFLLWGLIYFVAMGWVVFLPLPDLAWPVCIAVGLGATFMFKMRRRREGAVADLRSRSIEAVWRGMGIAVTLFVVASIVAHRPYGPTYVAAILFMVGMAHGISALILRWGVQGLAAAVWWACGTASLFFRSDMSTAVIFLIASFFGMILFGLYAMVVERRRGVGTVQRHA